jgi:hypothetical protein
MWEGAVFFTAEDAENAGADGRSLSVHAAQRNEQSKGGLSISDVRISNNKFQIAAGPYLCKKNIQCKQFPW